MKIHTNLQGGTPPVGSGFGALLSCKVSKGSPFWLCGYCKSNGKLYSNYNEKMRQAVHVRRKQRT